MDHLGFLDTKKRLTIRIIAKSLKSQNFLLHFFNTNYPEWLPVAENQKDIVFTASVRELSLFYKTPFSDYGQEIYCPEWHPVVPGQIIKHIVSTIGLETQVKQTPAGIHFFPLDATGQTSFFTADCVAKLYSFPTTPPGVLPGTGSRIGIVQLGGSFSQTELNTYFAQHSLGRAPTVNVVLLNGATQAPNSASIEVALDVQIIAAICPGASITIYFAPNSIAGFYDCISAAGKNSDIVSVSWGCDETSIPSSYLISFENLISTLPCPVFIASGDNGAKNSTDTGLSVSFPASCPHSIACGGTTLTCNPEKTRILSETAWSGSGGGYSYFFPKPKWQANILQNSKRGVPDICGNADPNTGYAVYTVATGSIVVGGTSAVAPLMSALFCLVNQLNSTKLSSVSTLYSLSSSVGTYRDVIKGFNGAYNANSGWDAIAGLGVPIGSAVQSALIPPESAPNPPPALPAPPAKNPLANVSIVSVSPPIIRSSVSSKITLLGNNLNTITAIHLQGRKAVITRFTKKSLTLISPKLSSGETSIDVTSTSGKQLIAGKLLVK